MDKLKNLKEQIETIQAKSVLASDMKAFITLVLKIIKETKDNFDSISKENLATIQQAIQYIEQEHEKVINSVSQETKEVKLDFTKQVKELKDLAEQVKAMKPLDGQDGEDGYTPIKGKDYFTDSDIREITDKIEIPELEAEQIKEKLESLEGNNRLDASAIKNLPDFKGSPNGGGWRNLYQLHDVELSSPTDNQVLTYDSASNTWKNENPTGGGTVGPGTINEIAYFDTTTSIASLSTATYPSLTELSYVKGVTSSIQTQLNGKASTTAYTLAGVSAISTDATKSLYTMTSTIPVEFRRSAGSSLLYLDEAGGRVGIGTTSFAGTGNATLNIAGNGSAYNLALTGAANGITAFAVWGGSTNMLWTPQANSFDIQTNSTNKSLKFATNGGYLWLDYTGNVGIGTNSPSYKLHIEQAGVADSFVGTRIKDTSAASTGVFLGSLRDSGNSFSLPGLWLTNSTPDYTNYAFLSDGSRTIFNAPGAQDINFRTNNGNVMVILNAGNVGFGTTTPAQRIDTNGGSVDLSGAAGSGADTKIWGGSNSPVTYINMYNSATGGIDIYNLTPTTQSTWSGALAVTGVLSTSLDFTLASNKGILGSGSTSFVPYDGGTGNTIFTAAQNNANFSKFRFLTGTTPTQAVLIDQFGFVGIGSSFVSSNAPDRLLHEEVSDSGTNAVVYGQRHSHITSGTATTGFGIGEEYELENASGTNRVAATQEFTWTDATNATEDTLYSLKLMQNGTLVTPFTVTGSALVMAGTFLATSNISSNANIHVGATGLFYWTNRSIMDSPADGVVRFTNFAGTNFGRVQLGGTTSSFPSLKRSTTGFALRLADDSASTWQLASKLVEANTAGSGSPNIITEAESGTVFTNEGSAAQNYHTLPTAVAGLTFTFYVDDADGIRVTANTGDIIQINGVASSVAGYTECTAIGGSLTLTAINATDWVATSSVGSWSLA